MSVFRDVSVVAKCFWAFILPVLEYCSPVWMSAATSHLSLLDRVVSQVSRLSGGSVSCDLWHRRKVASLSVFFKIDSLVNHPVCGLFLCVEETNPWSFWLLTLDLSRCLVIELCSFRALLFCFVFDCRTGCMNLYSRVMVWVLLKLQSIAFFSISFFFFPGPKIAWGSSDLQALCLYSCCFWSCLPWGCFSW